MVFVERGGRLIEYLRNECGRGVASSTCEVKRGSENEVDDAVR